MTANVEADGQEHSYDAINRQAGLCPVCERETVAVKQRTGDGVPYREHWHMTFDWNDEHDHDQEWCEEYPDGSTEQCEV